MKKLTIKIVTTTHDDAPIKSILTKQNYFNELAIVQQNTNFNFDGVEIVEITELKGNPYKGISFERKNMGDDLIEILRDAHFACASGKEWQDSKLSVNIITPEEIQNYIDTDDGGEFHKWPKEFQAKLQDFLDICRGYDEIQILF